MVNRRDYNYNFQGNSRTINALEGNDFFRPTTIDYKYNSLSTFGITAGGKALVGVLRGWKMGCWWGTTGFLWKQF